VDPSGLPGRLQAVAVLAAGLVLLGILELVRRRRLLERYALLWLGSALVLLVFAVWSDALRELASALGIRTPSNALFALAFGFVLVLLLHFSLVISRLSDQNKVLAQRLGLLQHELRAREPEPERERDPVER
jgi:hypothetical protein